MSPAKDPKKVMQGMRSRAQGDRFEQRIEAACTRHSESGGAAISKTPEPMKSLSQPNAYGQFKACYTKKAEPDFKGVLAGGRAIMFEAKSTSAGRMEQSRVTEEQGKVLDRYMAMGAHCFVLATFDEYRAYRVPWTVWREMKARYGRKYVTEEELRPYAVPLGPGYIYDLTRGIPGPDDIRPGASVGDILTAYGGMPYGSPEGGPEWNAAYERIVNLVNALVELEHHGPDPIADAARRRDNTEE